MIKQQDFFQIFIPLLVVFGVCDANAAVVQRASVSRAQVAARAPVVSNVVADDVVTVEETVVDTTVDVVEEPVFEFEDKTNQFDSAIGASSGTASGAVSDDDLAKMIRQQRAAADASSATMVSANAARSGAVSGQNACDIGLRKCMSAKCGNDFAKCAGDTDMVWGSKMDLCRRDLKCSGHEYSVFTAEIKADRDANAKLANFNAIVDCGNRYNSCIVNECGATFSKCVGKSAGDTAIAKCKKIQTECNKQDNGLAARMMNVFATVRQDAEKQILRDEKRLYELRELMASACRGMGAMFDERSLDCVYTVNFFANNSTTPYASKKSYAGGVFSCEPGWFGIDVTTFKENAYRLTRAQTAASSAMLGAGVGVAAGAISSGAIDRAIETKKAKNALKEAEKDEQKPTDDDIADNDEGTKSQSVQDNNKGAGSKENVNAAQEQVNVASGGNNANKQTENGKNAVTKNGTGETIGDKTVEGNSTETTEEKKPARLGGLFNKGETKSTANSGGGESNNQDSKSNNQTGQDAPATTNNDNDSNRRARSSKNDLITICEKDYGNMSGDKCSCYDKNGNGTILTKDPEQSCNTRTEALSLYMDLKLASEPPQETVAPEQKTENSKNDDEKKKVLNNKQKRACKNSGGNVNADSTLCSCKDSNGKDIDTDDPINQCVKPKKSAPEKTDGDSTDAGDGGSYDKCVSEMKFKYNMITIPKEARYTEILTILKTNQQQEYNKCLEEPIKETGMHKCTVNGRTYNYTVEAGDTVKGKVPKPCWMVLCPTELDMFLEYQAEEQFLDEMIEQECK